MINMFMESGFVSINKRGESICGDFYTTIKNKDNTIFVLSDGLGSGIKANILATLTAKILSTMIASNMSIEESIFTIAQTLPVCKVRRMAYSTFTIFRTNHRSEAYIAQFDNPSAILIRNGKNFIYESTCKIIHDKEIHESNLKLRIGDMLIFITDGVTSSGLGKTMRNGWEQSSIIECIEKWYTEDMSPQRMAATIASASMDLYLGVPDDDVTVAVFKICQRKVVNLIIGPPEYKEDDGRVLKLFFSKEGKKIVCGGTTARAVSYYLKREILTNKDTGDEDIPATSTIDGVDLVTEGVITLRKVVDIAREYLITSSVSLDMKNRNDGASMIAKMLFEEATDINLFVGKAMNIVNKSLDGDIGYDIKIGLINQLEELLLKMNKNVKISMC